MSINVPHKTMMHHGRMLWHTYADGIQATNPGQPRPDKMNGE